MNLDQVLEAISNLSGPDLRRVQAALEQRGDELKQSSVIERRNYGNGILQLEYRANPKTGTKRGPYWYFYWREEGHQHSLYVGKTDNPESELDEKLTYR